MGATISLPQTAAIPASATRNAQNTDPFFAELGGEIVYDKSSVSVPLSAIQRVADTGTRSIVWDLLDSSRRSEVDIDKERWSLNSSPNSIQLSNSNSFKEG